MSDEAKALWELLEAEREAARQADAMALLTIQSMKRDALSDLSKVPNHERMELVRALVRHRRHRAEYPERDHRRLLEAHRAA